LQKLVVAYQGAIDAIDDLHRRHKARIAASALPARTGPSSIAAGTVPGDTEMPVAGMPDENPAAGEGHRVDEDWPPHEVKVRDKGEGMSVDVSAGVAVAPIAAVSGGDGGFHAALGVLAAMPGADRDWDIVGRDQQKPPAGDWRSWLLLGGRGSGKTRAGAEWVHRLASAGERSQLRIALVAETLGDAREVMIDGVSGICRIARLRRPEFEVSRRRLVWPNGAMAQIFSSEDPESLRGPQFHFAWCDELAKWKYGQETFDMLQFGLRLGNDPRQLITTTPRPVPLLKALLADAGSVVTRLSTSSNAGNLAPGFISALAARYGGTRLGRQELDGELIEDREDGLWKRDALAALMLRFTGALRRIVVAVDPPASAGPNACCGIVVAGLEASGRAVVLADCSVEGASPATWATAVVKAYRRFDADRIVAEINQGGDMVTAMLRSIDANLPVTTVRATRGKFLRAEPVAALYEQGRVSHAGRFTALEDQMCDFGPDGLSSGRSPDRLDALVWALTALMLEGLSEPRVRGI
jgi:phage terminase large subunit-like protein